MAVLGALSLALLAVQVGVERSVPKVGKALGSVVVGVGMGLAEELSVRWARGLTRLENHRVRSTFEVLC